MDRISEEKRSTIMRCVKSKQTKPELLVRKLIFSLGFRYKLHVKELPGSPDIVFSRKKKIIFVHGCFWHQHADCKKSKLPTSNTQYWLPKLERNKSRDAENVDALCRLGWGVLIVWECQLRNGQRLKDDILTFLKGGC